MAPTALLHPFSSPALGPNDYINIVSGEGAVVTDDKGNEYIDAMASLWYCNVGYSRREVIEAITTQLNKIHAYHVFAPFANEPSEQLAARIASIAPIDDPRVFFGSSGSEAIDTALKIARSAQIQAGHPEKQIVISRSAGYHGTNYGGTSAQGIQANREGFGDLMQNHIVVEHDDVEALASVFADRGNEIAAVLTEPLQGAGGVYPPPDGYLDAVRRLCDEHGAYFIADEVINGFGRMGTWFGSQFYGVRPDMITFAKAVTSGYMPLSGVIVGSKVRAPLEADPSFILRTGYTYSGHNTACAAGLACLDVAENEGLLDRATSLGARLRGGLQSLVDDGLYTSVRGDGFVFALVPNEGKEPVAVRDAILAEGVIVRPLPGAISFCPPLVCTDEQVDRMVDAAAAVA